MRTALRCVVLAAAMVLGSLITVVPATAGPHQQAVVNGCGAMSTGAVFGGYRSRMVCDNRQIDGFGTTTSAAQQNANNMYAVALMTGTYCMTGTLPQPVSGGYRVGMSCNNNAIQGHGTTLTDTGNNLYNVGLLSGQYNVHCIAANLQAPAGGYRLALACNSRGVENYGVTLTDAARNVFSLAQLGGETGIYCSSASNDPAAGGRRLGLSCNSRLVHGLGSNYTDVGGNVAGFARLAAYTGRHCAPASSQPIAGGYRASFTCVPGGTFSGQGATLSAAAGLALAAAS